MTAASLAPEIEYLGNGSTYDFAAPFRFLSATLTIDLIDSSDAVERLTEGVDYSVAGGETDAGGTVTMVIAPAADERLRIRRHTPRAQQTDYETGDAFPAETHEAALDKAMLIDQEQDVAIADTAERALLVPDGDEAPELGSLADLEEGDILVVRDGLLQAWDRAAFAGMFLAGGGGGGLVPASGTGNDTALRVDLAAAGGAGLVGRGVSDVDADLTALETDSAASAAGLSERNLRNLDPIMIDLHWGVMKGTGWNAADPGDGASQKASTTTAAVAAGATTIAVAAAAPFVNGRQLIAFCTHVDTSDPDARWKTTVVASLSGTTLTLAEPCPAAIESGAPIGAFFNDYNHGREYGDRAIMDYALDQLESGSKRELLHVQRNYDEWIDWEGGVVTASASFDYGNPGSDLTFLEAALVTAAALDDGARTLPVQLPAGRYEAELVLNPGATTPGGARNSVQVFVEEEFFGTESLVSGAGSQTIAGLDSPRLVTVPFGKAGRSRVSFYTRNKTAGASTYENGTLRWYRVIGALSELLAGTWVALGDSWFAHPWGLDRLEARYPGIDLVRAGVSGNKVSDLLARFDAEVAPYAPRVVLIMVGTNDYAASVSRYSFIFGIRELIRRCQAIGAQPILFNCSVGDAATGTQLRNSREYAAALEYEVEQLGDQQLTVAVQSGVQQTLAPGDSVALLVSPMQVNRSVIVDYMAWEGSSADLEIRMGYTGSLSPPVGSLDDEDAFGATSFERENHLVDRTPSGSREFFMITAVNTDAAPQTLDFYIFRTRFADMEP